MEDVKLCCRRTPSLLEFIAGQADKLKAEKEAGKKGAGLRENQGQLQGERRRKEEGKRQL